MSPRTLLVLQSVLLSILGSPSGATAQGDHLEEGLRPRVRGAIDFLIARPLGEFADLVGYGAGWDLTASVFWGGSDRVALRASGGGITYGWETEKRDHGQRIRTTNDISLLTVGPEYSVTLGHFRPFVHASVGLASFVTTENEKSHWWEEGTETQILGDYAGSLGVGVGLDVKVRGGKAPVLLTLGGQYHRNGSARYLTDGAIVHGPDGGLTMYPTVSQANLVTFRIGAAFMFFG